MRRNVTKHRNWIRQGWDCLAPVGPLRPVLYSLAVGLMVPYTGTAGLQIVRLETGRARVRMRDRRRVRNHLRSVHAVAIANLAELCGSLAVVYGLPGHLRFIVRGFDLEFLKKARGTLEASATVAVPAKPSDVEVPVDVVDQAGVTVARARIRVRTGERPGAA